VGSTGDRGIEVKLGSETYRILPQKIGRINRKLSAVIAVFRGAATGDVPTEVGPQLYDALLVFIPDLDPMWRLAGWPNEAAYESFIEHRNKVEALQAAYAADLLGVDEGEIAFGNLTGEQQAGFTAPVFDDPRDDASDHSPTPPEIIDAIEIIFDVHGGQRLVRLLKPLISETAIRGMIDDWQIAQKRQRLESLRSLQRVNGGSAPTSSMTTAPTPPEPESEGSPLFGSLTSSVPTGEPSASGT
jgi:hypothetical protein